MKTKNIKQTIESTIKSVQINNEFSAFQIETYINGNKIKYMSYSGIDLTKNVENFNGIDFLDYKKISEINLNNQSYTSTVILYPRLFLKQFLFDIKNKVNKDINEDLEIQNPYEYLSNGGTDFVLLMIDELNNIILDENGNFIQRQLVYSNQQGIDNSKYNLKDLLEKLNENPNVTSLTGQPLEISRIPGYLSTPKKQSEIIFGLIPSQEIMNQFGYSMNNYDSREQILKLTLEL